MQGLHRNAHVCTAPDLAKAFPTHHPEPSLCPLRSRLHCTAGKTEPASRPAYPEQNSSSDSLAFCFQTQNGALHGACAPHCPLPHPIPRGSLSFPSPLATRSQTTITNLPARCDLFQACGPSSLKHQGPSGLRPPELTAQLFSRAPSEPRLLTFAYSIPLAQGALSDPCPSCPDLFRGLVRTPALFSVGPPLDSPICSVTASSLKITQL